MLTYREILKIVKMPPLSAPAGRVRLRLWQGFELEGRQVSLSEIANYLEISKRGLQRELLEQGESYHSLVSHVRSLYLVHYFSGCVYDKLCLQSLQTLAERCGYSHRNSLFNFCRENFGMNEHQLHTLVKGKKVPVHFQEQENYFVSERLTSLLKSLHQLEIEAVRTTDISKTTTNKIGTMIGMVQSIQKKI